MNFTIEGPFKNGCKCLCQSDRPRSVFFFNRFTEIFQKYYFRALAEHNVTMHVTTPYVELWMTDMRMKMVLLDSNS